MVTKEPSKTLQKFKGELQAQGTSVSDQRGRYCWKHTIKKPDWNPPKKHF